MKISNQKISIMRSGHPNRAYPSNVPNRWTEDEVNLLKACGNHSTLTEIAKALGRSEESVKSKINIMKRRNVRFSSPGKSTGAYLTRKFEEWNNVYSEKIREVSTISNLETREIAWLIENSHRLNYSAYLISEERGLDQTSVTLAINHLRLRNIYFKGS